MTGELITYKGKTTSLRPKLTIEQSLELQRYILNPDLNSSRSVSSLAPN